MSVLIYLLRRAVLLSVVASACVVPATSASPENIPVLVSDEQMVEVIVDGLTKEVRYGLTAEDDAVVQGDIILGRGLDIERYRSGDRTSVPDLFGLFRLGKGFIWPKGIVRYLFAADFRSKTAVEKAIEHWKERTRVQFELIQAPAGNYVLFANSSTGCSAHAGMQQGGQYVKLAETCSFGSAVHEIGHALGLGHEHMRKDRDLFVIYHKENVQEGMGYNFAVDQWNYTDIRSYCYASVMHYPETAFAVSANGSLLKTLVPKQPVQIGQRDGLSQCDIDSIEEMYATEFAKRALR